MFDLNIYMQIVNDKDFPEMRNQFAAWRKRFPMFKHDVQQIERIVEHHIQEYSRALVQHRQTHKKNYLEQAQKEIDTINVVLSTVAKLELMSMLSQR